VFWSTSAPELAGIQATLAESNPARIASAKICLRMATHLPQYSRRELLAAFGAASATAIVGATFGPLSASAATTSPRTVKPGSDFVGWGTLGDGDWPVAGSALIIRPAESALTVHRAVNDGTAGINLVAGASVSGRLGLLAVGEYGDWWKVLLPVRPNGTVGWVHKVQCRPELTTQRIVVDLSTNTLTYSVDGTVVLTENVATGTSGTPTPTGLFYVKSIAPQSNPNGALGPVVLVTSGYSTALRSFAGGAGAVGIHGTSAPGKLGQNVSHGCIRVRNDSIAKIAGTAPVGVPIEILARAADANRGARWSPPANALTIVTTTTSTTTTTTTTIATTTEAPTVPGGARKVVPKTPATTTRKRK
jgi:L,D-transpeptidase catalytic domain